MATGERNPCHAIAIDVRAAREILESLSRPHWDPQDAKLLEDLPAVHLAIQDSTRAPDVFERDFAAAFDETSRASVFDFRLSLTIVLMPKSRNG